MTAGPAVLIWFGASALVGILVAAIILFQLYRVRVPGVMNQVRAVWYVLTYDDALQWLGVSGKKRKGLLNELRSNISDAAKDAPMGVVLERLGKPRELARDIAAPRRGPPWTLGVTVGVCVWLAFGLASFVGLDVLSTGIEHLAPADASVVSASPLLPGVTYDVTTDGAGKIDTIGLESNLAALILPAGAFLVFSRPWRALKRRSSGEAAADATVSE